MGSQADKSAVAGIDVSRPHPARTYDYALGGKDNFAADRELMDEMLATTPTIRTMARENRAFLGRAVRYLTGQAGIRQFLDIGTGLPSANNVHEVAQGEAPDARVVYGGAGAMRAYRDRGVTFQLRDSDEFARLAFAGLDLIPPGVVSVSEWRPDETGSRPTPAEVSFYGGVARKP